MYADKVTNSMQKTIDSTDHRREKQLKYNEENNVTPTQIVKASREIIGYQYRSNKEGKTYDPQRQIIDVAADPVVQYMSIDALEKTIENTKKQMKAASKELDFIEAARLRDEMYKLQEFLKEKKK